MNSLLPEDFHFGVAMSGYQVEGGFNGPGEPANNWCWWERAGRVEPSGIAVDFWNRAEEYLDLAAGMGCDMVRLGIEWARVEPAEGQIDAEALARYAAIVDACTERGMAPLVTLHHFTHPAWLGEDFWLRPDSAERFATWAEIVVDMMAPRCRHWVTLNEINIVSMGSYLFGVMPPGRRGAVGDMVVAADNMLSAHVRAYEVIHDRQPDALVTTNNASASVYELDRLLVDLLFARSAGVDRADIGSWIADRRQAWYAELAPPSAFETLVRAATRAGSPYGSGPGGSSGRGVGAGWISRLANGGQAPSRSLDAIYASPYQRTLDVVGFDYYDPVATHHVRFPGHRTAGGRSWFPGRMLWDDAPYPEGLTAYCRANAFDGIGLWVVENGMCNRVRNGRSYDRMDGWTRPRYLRENLAAVVRAIDAGWPVQGYLHWSLVDNYEWGSYEPRFGIHGVDRERGLAILGTDAMGEDSAGEYRRLIEGLRSGDRSVLDPPW